MKKYFPLMVFVFAFLQMSAQEITQFPGFFKTRYYEDSREISKSDVVLLMEEYPAAAQTWQKSRVQMGIAWGFLAAEFAGIAWQSNQISNGERTTGPLIFVLGCAVGAVGFSLSANNLKRKAILSYNEMVDDKKTGYYLRPSTKGLGIALHF